MKNDSSEDFDKDIIEHSLSSLEQLIKDLCREKLSPLFYASDEKLEAALQVRCSLINDSFQFTPQAVMHLERVNNLLMESREMVWQKMRILSRQMLQLRESGRDDFMDDFDIEGNLQIAFTDERSLLRMGIDENNGDSDYLAMADVIHDFLIKQELFDSSYFSFGGNADWRASDEELGLIYVRPKREPVNPYLNVPELKHIDFCRDMNTLVDSQLYSLSDIIRINDVKKEVRVGWEKSGSTQKSYDTECLFYTGLFK